MARALRRLQSDPIAVSPALVRESALSIRNLKDLVIARFPEDHPLRAVILAERDVLTPA
jgi:hypothetical protein